MPTHNSTSHFHTSCIIKKLQANGYYYLPIRHGESTHPNTWLRVQEGQSQSPTNHELRAMRGLSDLEDGVEWD